MSKRPYDNQYNRYCPQCGAYRLHTRGRKYWTCLTCSLRTLKEQATPKEQADVGWDGTKHYMEQFDNDEGDL